MDEAVVCPHCGCPVENDSKKVATSKINGLIVAKTSLFAFNILIVMFVTIFTIWVNYLTGMIFSIIGLVAVLAYGIIAVFDYLKNERGTDRAPILIGEIAALLFLLVNHICWIVLVASMA